MPKKKTAPEPDPIFPDPPKYLSEKAIELYRFYVGLTIRAPAQIALFVTGLEALDTADEASRIIREEGLSQTSQRSGISRRHPLLNTQKEAMSSFLKIWKVLGLNSNSYSTPEGFGWESFI